MLEILPEDNCKLVTVADLKEFLNQLTEALAAAPSPLQLSPTEGGIVPESEVVSLHSETLTEDGRVVLRLFDLRDGRLGVQSFAPGEEPAGPVRYC